MKIAFYNFTELHTNEFKIRALDRIKKIIDESSFIEGEYNAKFEQEFAELQNAKNVLLVANGTDALEISLKAHGIGTGDRVAVSAITFFASAEAIVNVGAVPVMVDVNKNTGLMCPASLSRIMESYDIKAVMPVHIYGLPAPIQEIENICSSSNIPIIEDAAQAVGTHIYSGPVGSSNNLTTFSFYPTKNLSAFGDAGAICVADEELLEKIKLIRNHGRGPSGFERVGRNSRCDHIQAAILHLKLEDIASQNKKRKEIALYYREKLLQLDLRVPQLDLLEHSSCHLFPIGVKDEATKYKLKEHLAAQEIDSAAFYERTLLQEQPFTSCDGEDQGAQEFAQTTLCIPMNPYLHKEQLDKVVEEIEKFLQ